MLDNLLEKVKARSKKLLDKVSPETIWNQDQIAKETGADEWFCLLIDGPQIEQISYYNLDLRCLEKNILLSPLHVDSSQRMKLQDRKYLDENGSSHILPIRSIPKLECEYYT